MANTRPPNKLLTLVFVMKPGHVLLGYKKRGFGAGWWNGFGGKVESGETIESAAVRELHEESGLRALGALDEVGVIVFEFVDQPQLLEVHAFRTENYEGSPEESEEMRPQWFEFSEVPYDSMWPDDHLWYPYLLRNKYFDAFFKFKGHHIVLDHCIKERNSSESSQVLTQAG